MDTFEEQIEALRGRHEKIIKRLKGFAPLAWALMTPKEILFDPSSSVDVVALAMGRGMRRVLGEADNTITMTQIKQALGMPALCVLPELKKEILHILHVDGWLREKRQQNLVRVWLYVRPGK